MRVSLHLRMIFLPFSMFTFVRVIRVRQRREFSEDRIGCEPDNSSASATIWPASSLCGLVFRSKLSLVFQEDASDACPGRPLRNVHNEVACGWRGDGGSRRRFVLVAAAAMAFWVVSGSAAQLLYDGGTCKKPEAKVDASTYRT